MAIVKKPDTTINVGVVRFSYLHVFEPQAMQGSTKKKYSVSLIIDKTDTENLNKVRRGIELATQAGLTTKLGGAVRPTDKNPLRDGDTERPNDEAYRGKYFVNASCGEAQAPGIVDKNRRPIMDKTEVYSGMFGRANINFYAFNTNGNRGIACGLNHIQKIADGEPLSGRLNAEDAFDDGYEPIVADDDL